MAHPDQGLTMDILGCGKFRQARHYSRGADNTLKEDTIEIIEADEDSDPLMFLLHEEERLTSQKRYASFKELSNDLSDAIINKL